MVIATFIFMTVILWLGYELVPLTNGATFICLFYFVTIETHHMARIEGHLIWIMISLRDMELVSTTLFKLIYISIILKLTLKIKGVVEALAVNILEHSNKITKSIFLNQ